MVFQRLKFKMFLDTVFTLKHVQSDLESYVKENFLDQHSLKYKNIGKGKQNVDGLNKNVNCQMQNVD